ncbi:MAG: hypothetical protein KKD86_02260 [Bacteroidetes bacterium]|nr:hypothetical protein [Patescibacteria group bacterium]MBU1677672.1 hypothetical protein [Bacteroidota bacterium]
MFFNEGFEKLYHNSSRIVSALDESVFLLDNIEIDSSMMSDVKKKLKSRLIESRGNFFDLHSVIADVANCNDDSEIEMLMIQEAI